MGRRRTRIHDSLDLLLDAICNTFGGILFLAVLLAILVQFAGDRTAAPIRESASPESVAELQERMETRMLELKGLRRALKAQQASLDQFKPSEVRPMIDQVVLLRREQLDLIDKAGRLAGENASLEDKNRDVAKELRRSATELQHARGEEARLREELEREVQRRTRTSRLPVLRRTHKAEFPLLMRYGRLYWVFETMADKDAGLFNADDFVVTPNEKPPITPKRDAGLVIDASESMIESLKRKLGRLDPKHLYVAIMVWEDSFVEFGIVRNVLVDLGWEYRLMPAAEDHVIEFGSGRPNPLVQ